MAEAGAESSLLVGWGSGRQPACWVAYPVGAPGVADDPVHAARQCGIQQLDRAAARAAQAGPVYSRLHGLHKQAR